MPCDMAKPYEVCTFLLRAQTRVQIKLRPTVCESQTSEVWVHFQKDKDLITQQQYGKESENVAVRSLTRTQK